MRKILFVLVIGIAIIAGATNGFAAEDKVLILQIDNPIITVNGAEKEIDPGKGTSPIIKDYRTLVPIRAVIEELGGTIGWEEQERKVTLKLDSTIIELWIDQTNTRVNGEAKIMDVAPVEINGKTYLPVRFVAENLGCSVAWDETDRKITISSGSGVSQLGIQFVQNGKKYDVKNETEDVTLDKQGFSMRFKINGYDEENNKYYAAEIAALPDKDLWSAVKIGVNTDDIEGDNCFNPGRGMACYAGKQYDSMIVTPVGFHYIMYDLENKDNQRARLLEKTNDGRLNVEWDINQIYYEGNEYPVNWPPFDMVYLAFYIDNNLNDVIDPGELAKVKLNFK